MLPHGCAGLWFRVIICLVYTCAVSGIFGDTGAHSLGFFPFGVLGGKERKVLKIVVMKSPRLLSSILRLIFHIKKEETN